MTLGNVLALLQTSMKRMLAYSSIAHSGYMLVGLIAGPQARHVHLETRHLRRCMFYLLTYGIMSTSARSPSSTSLEHTRSARRRASSRTTKPTASRTIRGLYKSHQAAARRGRLVICAFSLLGLPPLTVGFFGKLPLFTAGVVGWRDACWS